ncbi:hypothetical protein, partial [Varibaculum cambriense]|uniref:hypothetical protein n=1 Tax=Varibaculum cambriense TaxID=184870 RepID=UPI0029028233
RHPAKSRAFSASPSIFLRFSIEYKKIHHVRSFPNNWYDYVTSGITNELAIALHSTQASPRNLQPILNTEPSLLRMDEEETSISTSESPL